MIIINDCSTDRTGEIGDRLAAEFNHVRIVHNPTNKGLGFNYQLGCQLARKDYVILVPGDNELHPDSVRYICQFAEEKDIIISYPENFHIRPLIRQIASRGFTHLINWISGYKLSYYNGTVLQKRQNILKIPKVTNSFAFQAEILIQMLRLGYSFKEVPFQLNFSSQRMTAFSH
ncbi:MAG: glycosyltransferase family 2 protein [Bdellovibrionales bacterium]|nr:glycosyltransferase family 2 protein [Bdellovibrionales bacterium]